MRMRIRRSGPMPAACWPGPGTGETGIAQPARILLFLLIVVAPGPLNHGRGGGTPPQLHRLNHVFTWSSRRRICLLPLSDRGGGYPCLRYQVPPTPTPSCQRGTPHLPTPLRKGGVATPHVLQPDRLCFVWKIVGEFILLVIAGQGGTYPSCARRGTPLPLSEGRRGG